MKTKTNKTKVKVTRLYSHLKRLGACQEALDWVGKRTPKQAWEECTRTAWLFWIIGKSRVDTKLIVTAACACARTALKYVPAGESRPLKAIETTERWCRGKATIEKVRNAAYAADAAYYDAANYAPYYAANAAAYYAADAAIYAADAAADAATHAANAAYYAANAVYDSHGKTLCNIIRAIIPMPKI